jgi:Lrp/AsnC family transcriptional regulator for asnA, asnC and gidA
MARGKPIPLNSIDQDLEANKNNKHSPENELNKQIIKMLQNDGRLPFSEIANELNVSEGTVRNRVSNMKEARALRIVAIADPASVEYRTDAMIGIKVSNESSPQQVAKRLSEFKNVVYILWVSGRFDLLVEIVNDGHDDFLEFVGKEIHDSPDIAHSEIMVGLKNLKNQFLLKRNWD